MRINNPVVDRETKNEIASYLGREDTPDPLYQGIKTKRILCMLQFFVTATSDLLNIIGGGVASPYPCLS
ncbi:MAG: hypothetical protein MUP17_07360 [candidate division Zixibacteria bacterium]|nr:hypothetical protein [candidate division Zixibacteria bacterium]